MKVTLFKPTLDHRGALFARQVVAQTTPDQLVVCESLAQLVLTLPRARIQNVILVLLAETREHLLALHSQRDLLRHYRIILVVPDGETSTLSTAHELRPRFVTNFCGLPEHLGAVLTKMLESGAVTHSPSSKLSLEQLVTHAENVDSPLGSEYRLSESKKPPNPSEKGES